MKTKEFFKAMGIRAIRTGAQTLLASMTVGMALTDIEWSYALSVTAVAMIASCLTSIITGLPETKENE